MEEIKLEKFIEIFPKPVSMKGIETILFQMKNCICKIYNKNKKGTGFFLKVLFPEQNNSIYLLVTNNHVLDNSDIENNKIKEITINDDSLNRNIKINNSRKRFTCPNLDITFVEIIPNLDKINNFLELDEEINKDISILETSYRSKSIYVLQYPKSTILHVSYGLLNEIQEDKKIIHIIHYCSTEEGSSSSPILSLENNRVIGMHQGSSKIQNIKNNYGIFIKIVLDKLYAKYHINNDFKYIKAFIQKEKKKNNMNTMKNIKDKCGKIIRQNSSINCVIKCLFSFKKFVIYLKRHQPNISQDTNKRISNSILFVFDNQNNKNWSY